MLKHSQLKKQHPEIFHYMVQHNLMILLNVLMNYHLTQIKAMIQILDCMVYYVLIRQETVELEYVLKEEDDLVLIHQ